jgi:hypothetical protein
MDASTFKAHSRRRTPVRAEQLEPIVSDHISQEPPTGSQEPPQQPEEEPVGQEPIEGDEGLQEAPATPEADTPMDAEAAALAALGL